MKGHAIMLPVQSGGIHGHCDISVSSASIYLELCSSTVLIVQGSFSSCDVGTPSSRSLANAAEKLIVSSMSMKPSTHSLKKTSSLSAYCLAYFLNDLSLTRAMSVLFISRASEQDEELTEASSTTWSCCRCTGRDQPTCAKTTSRRTRVGSRRWRR